MGLGAAALSRLLQTGASAQQIQSAGSNSGALGAPHFPAKAKRVIYLFQNGAPTHVELFDWKPQLKAMHGEPIPESYVAGKRFSTMTGNPQGKLMLAPVEPFHQRGQSGAWVSELLPHIAGV